MAKKQESSREENVPSNADDQVVVQRVQELTWALLDEQLNDDEFRLLENLLLSDDKARESYVGCVQLHANLMTHFATPTEKAGAKAGSKSSILGFLNANLPLGMQSPSAEEML